MKKIINNKSGNKLMAFDLFERKYQSEIEMMIESIIDLYFTTNDLNEKNYDDIYDNAHEEAIYVLAAEKKVTLE